MKEFLGTVKGKVATGIATLVVIVVVVLVALWTNRGYRIIAVEDFNGTTKITNGSKVTDVYVGLHFKSGDDARVGENADLTLHMDADKYVYAEPMTHFWVKATGKQASSKTMVYMDEGSNLFRIDKKLGESEEFSVETPNATMSVRGTVFRVSCLKDDKGDSYTLVEVFEGEVYVESVMEDKSSITDDRSVKAGQRAIIRSNPSLSEFVVDDKGEAIAEIDYKAIPQDTARFLGKTIEEGRELSIGEELLYDYVQITPHDFSAKATDELAPTCTEEGYYYPKCTVCGEIKSEKTVVKATGHDEYVKDIPGKLCTDNTIRQTLCHKCDVILKEEALAGKEHLWNAGEIAKHAGCTDDGINRYTCTVCKYERNDVIPATGHDYYVVSEDSASCTSGGSVTEKCSKCGDVTESSTGGPTGHNWSGWSVSGSDHVRTCSSCGDSDSHPYLAVQGATRGYCFTCGN